MYLVAILDAILIFSKRSMMTVSSVRFLKGNSNQQESLKKKKFEPYFQVKLGFCWTIYSPTSQSIKQICFADVSVLWYDSNTETKSKVVNRIWLTLKIAIIWLNKWLKTNDLISL